MTRDIETNDIFRRVAKKASLERSSIGDGPNAATFLSDLAEKITREGATTGDDLIDCLVAWYGDGLSKQTIDRYHNLDESLRNCAGEKVLLVTRGMDRRKKPNQVVESEYWISSVTGEGLILDLKGGKCSLPTLGAIYIDENGSVSNQAEPILICRARPIGFDDDWEFRTSTPDLSKDFTVDCRVKEAFDPRDYATDEHARESRKPPIEVVLGTARVMDYVAADSRLSQLA